MARLTRQRIGIPGGAYAERGLSRDGQLEQWCALAAAPAALAWQERALRPQQFRQAVASHSAKLADFGDAKLSSQVDELRQRLRPKDFPLDLSAEAFAVIREQAGRTLGMRHFDSQLLGGWILLNGMIAEMDTGEGKTLTATLAAATAALAGMPVHVITVNDYLAERDAAGMKPLYQALGLTVGVVCQGMDLPARRQAYACDVTYCTNKELVFDFLKDRIVLGAKASRAHLQLERLTSNTPRLSRLLLRGLHFAIVDEADSIFIDEARTPLIISREGGQRLDPTVYQAALALADQLELGSDFALEESQRTVVLKSAGRERLTELAGIDHGIWQSPWQREELVRQALTARHLMQRDTHYLVKDGKIQIIDEYTGRVMADRSWEHGLHQLIEAKEGCHLSSEFDPRSRISYQRFFRRYLRLAGMTGTAREIRAELWSVYRLPVVTVPPNRPSQRVFVGEQVYETAVAKWRAVVGRIAEVHRRNQPILIGTRTVGASEHLSALLTAVGLPHQVLNAKQDQQEAAIIAQAGQPGRITVATNMAGRGTDIRVTQEALELGGLYVLGTERHEAQRIDRQLFGRCGRQGDPGSYEMMLSLEDELFTEHGRRLRRWINAAGQNDQPITHWLGTMAPRWAQLRAEKRHQGFRRDLLKAEDRLATALAFSGGTE